MGKREKEKRSPAQDLSHLAGPSQGHRMRMLKWETSLAGHLCVGPRQLGVNPGLGPPPPIHWLKLTFWAPLADAVSKAQPLSHVFFFSFLISVIFLVLEPESPWRHFMPLPHK